MISSERPGEEDDADSARRLGDVAAERARRVRGMRRLRGLDAEAVAVSSDAAIAVVVASAMGAAATEAIGYFSPSAAVCVTDSPADTGSGDVVGALVARCREAAG